MTAPKPPDNKTLVGLPNELKAILERPRTSPPPLPAALVDTPQPAAAAQPSAQSMDRTLIGIPSETQAALERALAERARARATPRPQPLASAQVEVPPVASGSVLRVQAVRTIGVSNAPAQQVNEAQQAEPAPPQRPRAAHARRSPPPQQLPPRPNPARRSAPPQLPTAAQSRPPAQPQAVSQPASRSAPPQVPSKPPASTPSTPSTPGAAGQSQLTSPSELLAQSQITAHPFLAPNAPLDWPPAQRRSDSGFMPRQLSDVDVSADRSANAHTPPATDARNALLPAEPQTGRKFASQPIAAEPSVIVEPHEPELPLHLHLRDDSYASDASANQATSALPEAPAKPRPFALPPGSGHAKTKRTKAVVEAPPKRWPAISLIALAVVAFGCVVVLRAPNLLPAPFAAWVAPETRHRPDDAAEGKGARPISGASAAAAAIAPVAVKTLTTDTSAATNPTLAPPSPTRPPASPPFTSGISAQLEKKAIERLLAEDYPAALQAYERLRSAEPNRPEFGAMVELLTRAKSSSCGQPGQPACTGAVP